LLFQYFYIKIYDHLLMRIKMIILMDHQHNFD
jgi:hypothetical protein